MAGAIENICNERSSAAAEKNGEGMALKILTVAEDMPDGKGISCESYLCKIEEDYFIFHFMKGIGYNNDL
jgi:hypothetical protein